MFTTRMRDVWRSTQKICASTAERLCSSHTDSRATGACIHFNTADQQAAVVWSRFAGIIRRLGVFFGFFSCDNIGILELREASLKEYFRKRKRGNHRCEKAGAFRDLHLFFFPSSRLRSDFPVKCSLYLTDVWLHNCSLQVCIAGINPRVLVHENPHLI